MRPKLVNDSLFIVRPFGSFVRIYNRSPDKTKIVKTKFN